MAIVETNGKHDVPLVFVRPNSNVRATGTMLSSSMPEEKRIDVRVIGAGAVNQAVKSIILARQDLAGQGFDLVNRPGFQTVKGNDGSDVTAVVFRCFLLD